MSGYCRLRRLSLAALIWLAAGAVAGPLAVWAVAGPANAQDLSPQDRADIARVTDYLNGIRSLTAGFIQASPSGKLATGRLYLRRPDRLRFEYDPPSPLLLVGDGLWLILHDRELEQVSRWPIQKTPLGVLVAETVDLTERVRVTKVERKLGGLSLTFIDPEAPEEGSVMVVFSDPPLTLRQWRVIDARGLATDLSLREPKVNVPLEAELFTFQEPEEDPAAHN